MVSFVSRQSVLPYGAFGCLALIVGLFLGPLNVSEELLPYFPAKKLLSFGISIRNLVPPLVRTIHPEYYSAKCKSDVDSTNGSPWILGSMIKGGTSLGVKMLMEMNSHCGFTTATHPSCGDWNVFELSHVENTSIATEAYDLKNIEHDTMLAMAGDKFELKNVNADHARCVWFVREPLDVLVSMFSYAERGGQYDVLPASRKMAELVDLKSKLEWFMDALGRRVMGNSIHLYKQVTEKLKCQQIRMERIASDFDNEAMRLFDALAIPTYERQPLLQRLQAFDLKRNPLKGAHVSPLTGSQKQQIKELILKNREWNAAVQVWRQDLGYTVTKM